MEKDILIRIATENNAEAMIEFNSAIALETENKILAPEKISSGVKAVFGDKTKGFYVVAENKDSKIIGGLMVTYEWSDWRNGWFWWIQSVYILPEGRGKKIYSHLYDYVKEKATAEGNVCGFKLYVDENNKHAQKVYKSVGMNASNYLLFEEEV